MIGGVRETSLRNSEFPRVRCYNEVGSKNQLCPCRPRDDKPRIRGPESQSGSGAHRPVFTETCQSSGFRWITFRRHAQSTT
jgi:hypothetical protein